MRIGRLIARGHVEEQPAFRTALQALNEALDRALDEYEDAVRRVRLSSRI